MSNYVYEKEWVIFGNMLKSGYNMSNLIVRTFVRFTEHRFTLDTTEKIPQSLIGNWSNLEGDPIYDPGRYLFRP